MTAQPPVATSTDEDATTETTTDDTAGLRLLTPREVAALFRVPLSWVYDAAEDGRLPKVKLGRHLRFRADRLATVLDDLAS